jgi:hypothetical protein
VNVNCQKMESTESKNQTLRLRDAPCRLLVPGAEEKDHPAENESCASLPFRKIRYSYAPHFSRFEFRSSVEITNVLRAKVSGSAGKPQTHGTHGPCFLQIVVEASRVSRSRDVRLPASSKSQ